MSGRKICSRFERVIELFHFTMQFSNFSFVCFLLSIVFVMSLTKIIKIRKKLLEYFSVWRSYSLKEFLLENRSIFFSLSVTILEKRVLESELIFSLKEKLRANSRRFYFKHFENYVYLFNQIEKNHS